ncbi:MAG: sodium:proton antiporter [Gammaproteobacteria bacterium]|nr:sodium:proton antiporter [Gammaproteobacteria bacterium]
MDRRLQNSLVGIGCVLLGYAIWVLSPGGGESYGWWSLLPAGLTLLVCFLTRNVILALFIGIFAGGLVSGQLNIVQAYLIPSLGTENYAQILLVYLWALGGLLGLWNRNGGARYFAEYVSVRFVRSRVSAKFFAWIMGLIFHQGGTISTVLTGTTVRPVSDREKVAHEELAYVVDSTASPIATIIPFNVWPTYVAGLITIDALAAIVPDEASAIGWFLKAIPYNFYAWIAVLMTLLFAFDKLPFLGKPMRAAVSRVATTGELDRPGAIPMASSELTEANLAPGYKPALIDFIGPIATLLGFCIIPWLLGGSPMVFEAFALALVVSMVLSVLRGMSITDAFDALLTGIKGVTVGAIILGLAVTLGTVSTSLNTSVFIIDSTAATLSVVPYILPSLMMLICMVISFSIGSSWGTYAVIFPIALPLAYALSPDPGFFTLTFGAILGGAVFGDQCSPISDTTILSSLACGSDLMEHVTTQLPLATSAAGIAACLYLVIAFFQV